MEPLAGSPDLARLDVRPDRLEQVCEAGTPLDVDLDESLDALNESHELLEREPIEATVAPAPPNYRIALTQLARR